MGHVIDFTEDLHRSTKRDYLARAIDPERAANCAVAKQFGKDYWDGDRKYGYGGYQYDGRWRPVAERIAAQYNLQAGERVLDVGCGKGYLLYELMKVVPGLKVMGIDVSCYALENAHPDVRENLYLRGTGIPCRENQFDCVISLATLHNLKLPDLYRTLKDIAFTARSDRNWIMVESWRTEQERLNLLNWQLTCQSFYTPDEWKWIYDRCGYRGDYGFIYFE